MWIRLGLRSARILVVLLLIGVLLIVLLVWIVALRLLVILLAGVGVVLVMLRLLVVVLLVWVVPNHDRQAEQEQKGREQLTADRCCSTAGLYARSESGCKCCGGIAALGLLTLVVIWLNHA